MEHMLTGHQCWCQPRVEQPCRACHGEVGDRACQACAGDGWEAAYTDSDDVAAVVIHHDIPYA